MSKLRPYTLRSYFYHLCVFLCLSLFNSKYIIMLIFKFFVNTNTHTDRHTHIEKHKRNVRNCSSSKNHDLHFLFGVSFLKFMTLVRKRKSHSSVLIRFNQLYSTTRHSSNTACKFIKYGRQWRASVHIHTIRKTHIKCVKIDDFWQSGW